LSNLPDRPASRGEIAERKLSNRDFEMVIRRAAELQAREAEEFLGEGISEAEVLRIGRELGLSSQHIHRALAETAGVQPQETGVADKLFGPEYARAGRAVRGEPETVAKALEWYLVEREYLAVQRRFGDRVTFTRASGMFAVMGRATSQMFSRSPLLKVANLDMAVQPFDEGFSYVTIGTSLRGQRTATAASSFIGGGAGAAVTGVVLGIAIAPPAALIALPVLGVSYLGGKSYYQKVVSDIQVQLESLLDRLEHGELPPPRPRPIRP
jgi:hypothetical protein